MLKETLDAAFLHYNRALDSCNEIKELSLTVEIYKKKENIKTIDAFLFRYIKLQDFMGDKLFKQLLARVGEYIDSMSYIDVLDKLEKLEIVSDADKWFNYREIRNELTHEYPNNEEDIIDGIKLAVESFVEMGLVLNKILQYVSDKKLI